MDFSIKTTVVGGGDYRWLGSKHARDTADSCTIDVSLLTAKTHYDANGVVPSGLPLGKVTVSKKYGPFDPAATDGREVLEGFLLEPVQLEANFNGLATANAAGALLRHAIINTAFVPTAPALSGETKTTGDFVFVK
ncbi:head decoration protein [Arthrobacter russicus]|uniref:K structural protein n=1 Tax=Arthrobacter russicus TaxID=172040 RepID=A0ABU1JFI4_9MICC|nr:head decoration protein [Arthrobacter russicus]MDR6270601.1 hypothetical protein [Arthrobacter russicus]